MVNETSGVRALFLRRTRDGGDKLLIRGYVTHGAERFAHGVGI